MDEDTMIRFNNLSNRLFKLENELDEMKKLLGDLKKEIFEATQVLYKRDSIAKQNFDNKWNRS